MLYIIWFQQSRRNYLNDQNFIERKTYQKFQSTKKQYKRNTVTGRDYKETTD